MRIAVGADHAGFSLKEHLAGWLALAGHEVRDLGTHSGESVDYPDFAKAVADAVASGSADRGLLVCFTGAGMAIAANKVDGVRATLGWNPDEVRLTREHNDANVLTLGAKFTQADVAEDLLRVFLSTSFQDGGRHARRVEKIAQFERD